MYLLASKTPSISTTNSISRFIQKIQEKGQNRVFLKRTIKFFENYEIIHGSSWRAMHNNGENSKELQQTEHSQIPCVWST